MNEDVLCSRPGIDVVLVDTEVESLRILRLDVSRVPAHDDLDAITTILATFLTNCDGRLVCHVKHVDSDSLAPPDMACMLQIVGKLLEVKSACDAKVKGVLLQAKRVDDAVLVAKKMFLSMYPSKLDVVTDDECARTFVEGVLERERRRRQEARTK